MRLGKFDWEEDNSLQCRIEEFIALKETQGKEKRTLDDYRKELNKFYEASSKKMDEGMLRRDLLDYFAAIPSTSSAVYNRPYSCLNAFFNYCVRQDYLGSNPLQKAEIKKKKDDSRVVSVSVDDVGKLIRACDKRTYTGFRDFTIITLMLDTGIRTSELVRLRDEDFQRDRIIIRPEICKTKTSRVLYLSHPTIIALEKLIKFKNGFSTVLFPSREGNMMDTNQLSREFRRLSDKAGVKITPYQLRHTFATVCVENGINVFLLQQLMGHSDIAMTRRYTDINQKQLEEAHSTFSPLLLLDKKKRL